MTTRRYVLFWLTVVLSMPYAPSAAQTRNGFDLAGARVPIHEILPGGPPRDGIPAIDRPRFIAAAKAFFLSDHDRVLGIVRHGIAKAYPVKILNWHEIVNDQFANEAIVVTYCPLCGTGMAFRPPPGGPRSFGVSGLLYNSDLLLYDRRTESLWSQIDGRAIAGPLRDQTLVMVPVHHTSWKDWHRQHPRTLVLSTETGFHRDYNHSPYENHDRSAELYFPVSHQDRRFHPKSRVLGVNLNGQYKAYPFSELARTETPLRDKVGETPIIIHFNRSGQSAFITDPDGTVIPSLTAFWFAWIAFHPDSDVFVATPTAEERPPRDNRRLLRH